MSGDSSQRRRSSAESKELLIETCIELLGTRSVAEITNRLLEEVSGLNRSYVTRYFGSQDGLFLAVFRELEERIAQQIAGSEMMDLAFVSRQPSAVIRLKLSNWLQAHGHEPATLLGMNGAVSSRIRERLAEAFDMSSHALDMYALHLYLIAVGVTTLREALDLSDETINELQALEQQLVLNSAKIIADLGW